MKTFVICLLLIVAVAASPYGSGQHHGNVGQNGAGIYHGSQGGQHGQHGNLGVGGAGQHHGSGLGGGHQGQGGFGGGHQGSGFGGGHQGQGGFNGGHQGGGLGNQGHHGQQHGGHHY